MSNDPLRQLEGWAGTLLAKLGAPARRRLAVTIARELRRSQQQRIASQQDAEGRPFIPRKPRLRDRRGTIRRLAAMFVKLRTAKWMRIAGTANVAEVGFQGRVARIARIHQEGLHDRATPTAPEVRYTQRALLGFNNDERELVRVKILMHLQHKG